MKHTYNLQVRTSHGYRGGWSYMDTHREIGDAAIVSSTEDEDYDDGYCYRTGHLIVDVSLNQPESADTIKSALCNMFGGSNCTHEHDCCGCWSFYADAYHITKNRWYVERRGSQNY